jgi:hypothetical protein
MKVMTFAAGLAAGFVLGSRAGREKYEQIVAGARKVGDHPMVVQAQEKAKGLLSAGPAAPAAPAAVEDEEVAPLVYPTPTRSSRRKAVVTEKATGTAPLA